MRIWRAYEKPTPCKTCLPPTLEMNQPYLTLYRFCSDQLIMGPNGAIGMNFLAVDRAMDYFKVDEDERSDFYSKVKFICLVVLNTQYEEQKAKDKQKK